MARAVACAIIVMILVISVYRVESSEVVPLLTISNPDRVLHGPNFGSSLAGARFAHFQSGS